MIELEHNLLIQKASNNYVKSHTDAEVRRMYGHHFRSFRDGARWALENIVLPPDKPVPEQEEKADIITHASNSILFLSRIIHGVQNGKRNDLILNDMKDALTHFIKLEGIMYPLKPKQ